MPSNAAYRKIMLCIVTKTAFVLVASSCVAVFADDVWPEVIHRAWVIKEAKVLGDATSDEAAKENLLLLVGQRVYFAIDQNSANGHNFSESPMLLEKGFLIDEVTHNNKTTAAYARHKEGRRKLILTPTGDNQYLLRVTFTEKVLNDYKMHLTLEAVDQKSAKNRVRKILASGELQGTIQMKAINEWLAKE